MDRVLLAMIVHAHQPVGNFDHVVEEAYQKSYLPFVQTLARHPQVRLSLHFSGSLLEWIAGRHPEYLKELGRLVSRQQVEMIGGGYYEPILTAIPDCDKIAQIQKLAQFLKHHFGETPKGAWVAERVWEPSLARPLAQAGVSYAALDDTHFLAAGLEPAELHGDYVTEDAGHTVRLIPSLKSLRYTIPFREVEATLGILREGLNLPNRLFAFGDDCEKFGVWPGTYDHCYTNGWLERFLKALEGASEWLETVPAGVYIEGHEPLGRIYLPTASYAEMMEWALPPAAARELKGLLEQTRHLGNGELFQRFLRGGIWRNFLAKYSEANQIHKLMLEISERIQQARPTAAQDSPARGLLNEAEKHLHAGQCNDAYWHGVFGGLYAPHLRSALLRSLIHAESLLDQLDSAKANGTNCRMKVRDFDADGREEILIEHSSYAMRVNPADGGTVSSLRFKPCHVELINSLRRRPEAYHDALRQAAQSSPTAHEGPASIHEIMKSKGAHLDALLQYDRYERRGFRSYVFPIEKQWQDFQKLDLEEQADLAGGRWETLTDASEAQAIVLRRRAQLNLRRLHCRLDARKRFSVQTVAAAWRLECHSSIQSEKACSEPLALGIELVFNLLAPNAPDRYFAAHGIRRPLSFAGEIDSDQLEIVDEWQKVRVALTSQPSCRWWLTPIETVSQSESGFESVYQGSAILAVWRIDPAPWHEFASNLRVDVMLL